MAVECIGSDGPLEEKMALLLAAGEADAGLADRLYNAVFDGRREARTPVVEAALVLLLKDLKRPHPDPATWRRLESFVLKPTSRPGPDAAVRSRLAEAFFAAAPEKELERAALAAERSPDPAFLREALRGLASNPSPRAQPLAAGIASRRGWNLDEAWAASGSGPAQDE